MQYLDFEGNIPKGEYGGGAMIVWDRGRWEAAADPDKGLAKGHLDITLARQPAQGPLASGAHAAAARREDRAVAADQGRRRIRAARRRAATSPTRRRPRSLSGRTTDELAAVGELRKDHAGRAKVIGARKTAAARPERRSRRPQGHPAGLPRAEPAASRPTRRRAARNGCTRSSMTATACRRASTGGKVRLLTRKGLDWTARFPSIAAALTKLELSSALIDGEIVVEDTAGIPSFTLLQSDLQRGPRRSIPLLRVRSALLRRLRPHPGDALGSQGAAAADRRRACRPARRSVSASIWRRTGRRCSSMPAASGWKASSRSGSTCPTGPGAASIGSRSKACRARSSSSSATCPRPPPKARSARCSRLLRRAARCTMPAASAPAIPAIRRDRCATSSTRSPRRRPKLGNSAARRRREGRALGRAASWSARSNSRLDRRRLIRQAAFKGLREDRAAGRDRARGCAGNKSQSPSAIASRRCPRASHPSRTHPLAGAGRHQGGPGRILRRHRRLDPAAPVRARAEPRARPSGVAREVLLRQACLGRPERRVRRVDVGEKETMLDPRQPRRTDRPGAGRRGRDPSLGIAPSRDWNIRTG